MITKKYNRVTSSKGLKATVILDLEQVRRWVIRLKQYGVRFQYGPTSFDLNFDREDWEVEGALFVENLMAFVEEFTKNEYFRKKGIFNKKEEPCQKAALKR